MDRPEEIGGAALEGLVYQHLTAWNSYSGESHRIFYWRTASGVKVDFIIYGNDVFWAIEVKNRRRVDDRDLSPLKEFQKDYPQCQAFLLYRGREKFLKDGIMCLPCEIFLQGLNPRKVSLDL